MNEPAFPVSALVYNEDGKNPTTIIYDGMTLRDYFAAKAMQSMISQYPFSEIEYVDVPYLAYKLADAMVLHGEKTK